MNNEIDKLIGSIIKKLNYLFRVNDINFIMETQNGRKFYSFTSETLYNQRYSNPNNTIFFFDYKTQKFVVNGTTYNYNQNRLEQRSLILGFSNQTLKPMTQFIKDNF